MGGFDSRDANDVFVRRGNADDQAPAVGLGVRLGRWSPPCMHAPWTTHVSRSSAAAGRLGGHLGTDGSTASRSARCVRSADPAGDRSEADTRKGGLRLPGRRGCLRLAVTAVL